MLALRRLLYTTTSRTYCQFRAMSSAPALKPFNLALIQLGQVGPDKDGLYHRLARPLAFRISSELAAQPTSSMLER